MPGTIQPAPAMNLYISSKHPHSQTILFKRVIPRLVQIGQEVHVTKNCLVILDVVNCLFVKQRNLFLGWVLFGELVMNGSKTTVTIWTDLVYCTIGIGQTLVKQQPLRNSYYFCLS